MLHHREGLGDTASLEQVLSRRVVELDLVLEKAAPRLLGVQRAPVLFQQVHRAQVPGQCIVGVSAHFAEQTLDIGSARIGGRRQTALGLDPRQKTRQQRILADDEALGHQHIVRTLRCKDAGAGHRLVQPRLTRDQLLTYLKPVEKALDLLCQAGPAQLLGQRQRLLVIPSRESGRLQAGLEHALEVAALGELLIEVCPVEMAVEQQLLVVDPAAGGECAVQRVGGGDELALRDLDLRLQIQGVEEVVGLVLFAGERNRPFDQLGRRSRRALAVDQGAGVPEHRFDLLARDRGLRGHPRRLAVALDRRIPFVAVAMDVAELDQ